MGEFEYTARSARGETVIGTINADSEAAVLRVLEEKALFPFAIRSLTGGAEQGKKRRRGRIPSRDLGVMYSQLADLLGSGVPLLRALKSLVKSTVNARLREVLKEIQGAVADGKSLTEAMRQHPQVFFDVACGDDPGG